MFCLMFVHLSCKKESDIIDIVSVSGKVWDNTLQKSVSNLLVYIYDVKCENFHCGYNKVVDSTRTDSNGFYKIEYPRRNYNTLYLKCSNQDYSYTNSGEFQIEKGGKPIIKNFSVNKTSVLKTRLIFKNNIYPPFRLSNYTDGKFIQIYGLNKDTIIYLKGIANSANFIVLSSISDFYSYYRRRDEIITLGTFADTLNVTIDADDVDKFPIKSK
jgi:hypothetical protein